MTRTMTPEQVAATDYDALPQIQDFPAMHFYPKEWITGQATRAMSAEERGGFINLLAEAWDQKPPCSLPDDDGQLANIAGLGTRWKKAGPMVRAHFVKCPDGRLRNPKQVAVWIGQLDLRLKRRGSRYKRDPVVDTTEPSLLPPAIADTEAAAGASASHDAFDAESAFAEFWNLILVSRAPNPFHKSAALRTFRKSVTSAATFERIKKALVVYASSKRVRDGFAQDASTWLNDWQQWENAKASASLDTMGYSREEWMTMFPSTPYGRRDLIGKDQTQ